MNINELNRNQITQMAISYMGLRPKSTVYPSTKEMSFHCPFHKDKTPSLFINLDMGVFNCFSCGRSGSIESLFKEYTNSSLYTTLGIDTSPFNNYARLNQLSSMLKNEAEDNFDLKKVYINFDSSKLLKLKDSPEALDYIERRGIPLSVAIQMKFKFIREATLINNTKFENRLVIPIYENNRLISIEGRKVGELKEKEPKVLYPKNCSVNSLYDIDNLDTEEPLYVVEGLMDLAVLRSSDFFKNSSAIFGANLTKRQIKLLLDFKKVVYIPDADQAGDKTVEKLKDTGYKNIYILRLPKVINNVNIKDVGDIPKAGISIDDLLNRKWLKYEKKLNH